MEGRETLTNSAEARIWAGHQIALPQERSNSEQLTHEVAEQVTVEPKIMGLVENSTSVSTEQVPVANLANKPIVERGLQPHQTLRQTIRSAGNVVVASLALVTPAVAVASPGAKTSSKTTAAHAAQEPARQLMADPFPFNPDPGPNPMDSVTYTCPTWGNDANAALSESAQSRVHIIKYNALKRKSNGYYKSGDTFDGKIYLHLANNEMRGAIKKAKDAAHDYPSIYSEVLARLIYRWSDRIVVPDRHIPKAAYVVHPFAVTIRTQDTNGGALYWAGRCEALRGDAAIFEKQALRFEAIAEGYARQRKYNQAKWYYQEAMTDATDLVIGGIPNTGVSFNYPQINKTTVMAPEHYKLQQWWIALNKKGSLMPEDGTDAIKYIKSYLAWRRNVLHKPIRNGRHCISATRAYINFENRYRIKSLQFGDFDNLNGGTCPIRPHSDGTMPIR